MGKDKKKKKGLGKEKTERKTAKKDEKRRKKELDTLGEEDIEETVSKLERLAAAARSEEAGVEEVCEPPSARSAFSLVSHPHKEELILFGGEYNNGQKIYVYGDLYRYKCGGGADKKGEWKVIKSPTQPPPRSGHQAVCTSVFGRDIMIVFGGEYTSPSQSQFHHYRDTWIFDFATNRWQKIDSKTGPSPRSGHRMVMWKSRKVLLFGGFFDNLREVKYFNDLWTFDLDTMTWEQIKFRPEAQAPPCRSACLFFSFGDSAYVYGGYNRIKDKKGEEKSQVLSDFWTLHMNAANNTYRWEKSRKSGTFPFDRSGMSCVVHKKRLIIFGGVRDEDKDDVLISEFYNDMFIYQFESNRFFPLVLRGTGKKDKKSRSDKKKETQRIALAGVASSSASGSNDADDQSSSSSSDSDMESNKKRRAAAKKSKNQASRYENNIENLEEYRDENDYENDEFLFEGMNDDQAAAAAAAAAAAGQSASGDAVSKEPDVASPVAAPAAASPASSITSIGAAASADILLPCPRISSGLAVVGNTLFLYGGLLEHYDREITLDDMFSLDLNKCQTFKVDDEGRYRSQQWLESDEEDGDDDDDDDDDDEDDSDEEDEEEDDEEDEDGSDDEQEEDEAEKEAVVVEKEKKKSDKKEKEKGGKEKSAKKEKEEKKDKDKKSKKDSKAREEEAVSAATRSFGEMGVTMVSRSKESVDRNQSRDEMMPLVGETLKEFFSRTSEKWMQRAVEAAVDENQKDLRKNAFALAQNHFAEQAPIVAARAEEDAENAEEEEDSKGKGSRSRR